MSSMLYSKPVGTSRSSLLSIPFNFLFSSLSWTFSSSKDFTYVFFRARDRLADSRRLFFTRSLFSSVDSSWLVFRPSELVSDLSLFNPALDGSLSTILGDDGACGSAGSDWSANEGPCINQSLT